MPFEAPPAAAAWQHQGARTGFEVVYFRSLAGGYRVEGHTTAIEDGQTWAVSYDLRLDAAWTTRTAQITGGSAAGCRQILLEADGAGRWLIDGTAAPHLDGCLDVDLESSAMTNALPVHRLDLPVGAGSAAPAAYVRALDLSIERLDQHYVRVSDEESCQRYGYTAPAFDFACTLVYDRCGLVLVYPGIAVRAG